MTRHYAILLTIALFAAGASAQVVINGMETFDKTATNGALWGAGGGDPFTGWQTAYINHDPTGVFLDRFWFGNDQERHYGTAVDQPYPGSHTIPPEGTLLVQHDCCWGNSTNPGTGEPWAPSSDMIAYVSFNATATHVYQVSAWINTIENQVDPANPLDRDGIHPRVVNPALAGFPTIRIGLKNGLFDPGTDFNGPWIPALGLVDKTWIQTPTVETTAVGGPMTIILQVQNPDTKCGVNIITNTVWDDVEIIDLGPACNVPFADTDADGDVDQQDYAVLQACYTGLTASGPLPEECLCLDRDLNGASDGLINSSDIQGFESCATGPSILHALNPNPNCTHP